MDDDFCYLTTRGRVTGQPHEIEIWFAVDGDTVYLLSGGGDRSDWVRNLRAEPAVTVRVSDTTYRATARVIEGSDEERRARTLVFDKYQPRNRGELVTWRGRALPVALDVHVGRRPLLLAHVLVDPRDVQRAAALHRADHRRSERHPNSCRPGHLPPADRASNKQLDERSEPGLHAGR